MIKIEKGESVAITVQINECVKLLIWNRRCLQFLMLSPLNLKTKLNSFVLLDPKSVSVFSEKSLAMGMDITLNLLEEILVET